MFTLEELRSGTLSGEPSPAHKKDYKGPAPTKLDEERIDCIQRLFEERMGVISNHFVISMERTSISIFKTYIREALAPVKKAVRVNTKKAAEAELPAP